MFLSYNNSKQIRDAIFIIANHKDASGDIPISYYHPIMGNDYEAWLLVLVLVLVLLLLLLLLLLLMLLLLLLLVLLLLLLLLLLIHVYNPYNLFVGIYPYIVNSIK